MATLTAFKRNVKAGTPMICVENTYRPDINGQKRTVLKAGTAVIEWVGDGEGCKSRTPWPKARDVVSVSDNQITWRLFPGRDGKEHHTVTLRLTEAQ